MTLPPRRTPAILGASGYIGQHFVRLLATHPWWDDPILVGSPRTAGRRLEEVWQLPDAPPSGWGAQRLVSAGPAALARQGVSLAFGAMPSGTAGRVESECARRGIRVFSNASDHRRDPKSCLLIPEVNGERIDPRRTVPSIITNPNCSATGLALALAPIVRALRPRTVHVATYQALSGAGYPGVASLSITDNVIPYIEEEEEKISWETGQLLRDFPASSRRRSFPIVAQCARVGVRDGHLEAVTVTCDGTAALSSLRAAWRSFSPLERLELPTAPLPPVVVRDEPDRPQPLRDRWAGTPERARGMAVTVGRLRWERPFLRFFVLSHNAVRGGAGGSVLNAEFVERRRAAAGVS